MLAIALKYNHDIFDKIVNMNTVKVMVTEPGCDSRKIHL
jgi:hypothetical protein